MSFIKDTEMLEMRNTAVFLTLLIKDVGFIINIFTGTEMARHRASKLLALAYLCVFVCVSVCVCVCVAEHPSIQIHPSAGQNYSHLMSVR